jgi:hypothetical protein
VPTAAKAQLFLTVDIDDLAARVGAATTVGSADPGTVLAPETVRRIGCDAGHIPTVMAGPRHVLDLGHTTRWFTPAQTKALWLRDRHCTIPGCAMPAQMGRRTPHPALGRRRPHQPRQGFPRTIGSVQRNSGRSGGPPELGLPRRR